MTCSCSVPQHCEKSHVVEPYPIIAMDARDAFLHAEYEKLGMGNDAPKYNTPDWHRQRAIFRELVGIR